MKFAASIEALSEHPLAHAIVKYAKEKNIRLQEVHDFENVSGSGVQGKIEGNTFRIGNVRFMGEQHREKFIALEKEGKTFVGVSRNNEFIAVIAIADTLKHDAKEAVQKLRDLGIEIVMITGDNLVTARSIAKSVGI